MKMKPEHYQHLQTQINDVVARYGESELIEAYQSGQFPRADKVKNLQKRFCFDLLLATNQTRWIFDNLYDYLTDDHIYTALKRMCPTIEEPA